MTPLRQRITTLTDTRLAAVTDTAANLKAQLFELERLREQVGRALLSAEKSLQPRRNGNCAIPPEIEVNLPSATE
jgi:hypothetical protein